MVKKVQNAAMRKNQQDDGVSAGVALKADVNRVRGGKGKDVYD